MRIEDKRLVVRKKGIGDNTDIEEGMEIQRMDRDSCDGMRMINFT